MSYKYSDELYHYGIKGQKWGRRRYQHEDGTYTEEGKERRRKGDGTRDSDGESRKIGKSTANSLLASVGNRRVGAIDPASALVALQILLNAGMITYQEYAMRKEQKENKERNGSFDNVKKIKTKHTKEEDQAAINPKFNKGPEYRANCMLCTTAYEMRRRGYDVEASTSKVGRTNRQLRKYFNGAKVNRTFTYLGLKRKLNEMPDGSRGNVIANVGIFGSRHSMVWEKENGNVIIRDCQSNKTYDSIDKSIIRHDYLDYRYIRTDNLDVNETEIMDAISPRN